MGYYTSFRLSYKCKPDNHEELITLIREETNNFDGGDFKRRWNPLYSGAFEGFDGFIISGMYVEDLKWYGYQYDMYKLSIKFPSVVFNLEGIGEYYFDHWEETWVNGKFQRRVAEIPDFDETMLEVYIPPIKKMDEEWSCVDSESKIDFSMLE